MTVTEEKGRPVATINLDGYEHTQEVLGKVALKAAKKAGWNKRYLTELEEDLEVLKTKSDLDFFIYLCATFQVLDYIDCEEGKEVK